MKILTLFLLILTFNVQASPIAVERWKDHTAILKYKDDDPSKGLMLEVLVKNKIIFQVPGLGHGNFKLSKGKVKKQLFFEDINNDGHPEIVFKTLVNPAIIIKGFTLVPGGDQLIDTEQSLLKSFR